MSGPQAFELRLHGERVGALEVENDGARWVWWFDPAWLDVSPRPTLSLRLRELRLTGRRTDNRPPPFVTNLLPERGSALRGRLARVHGLSERDDAALLTLLGGDMSGALQVIPGPGAPRPRAERLAASAAPLARYRASLGGMQLKFSANRSTRINLAADGETGKYILKIPLPSQRDLPSLEAATLTWAEAVGFEAPERDVVPSSEIEGLPPELIEGIDVCLLVRRFDRPSGDERLHMEEICSAMGYHPEEKYPADAAPTQRPLTHTLAGVGGTIRRYAGVEAAHAFVERVVFDALAGNGDAHLKNWAFVFPDRVNARLAPVYDVLPTFLVVPGDDSLALPISGHDPVGVKAFEGVTPGVIRSLAKKLQLDPDESEARSRALVARAVSSFDAAIAPWALRTEREQTWRTHLGRVAAKWA